jgi:hypothetical protein
MFCAVSHDAGGAEIISSFVRQQGLPCQYVLSGPSLGIFQRKLGPIESRSLDDAIHSADWFLCGTSWQSDLEFKAIQLARNAGKKSVAFIDHWINFQERFTRGSEMHLPDEIWVGDLLAETIARNLFPGIALRFVENPYFLDIKHELTLMKLPRCVDSDNLSVLYVCEPVREHALLEYGNERYWGYTEEEALRYFLDNLDSLGGHIGSITIRPHPSEEVGKYRWASEEYKLPIFEGGSNPLTQEVSACDVVVGCESMAMVVGLLGGRRVVSTIPPGGHPCRLPHHQIESLQVLASAHLTPSKCTFVQTTEGTSPL